MEDDIEPKTKMPKVAKVKNKMPAPVQITAEQLLREAKERELELVQPPPKQKISDEAELKDYRMRKRKAFEDSIRKNRSVISNWLKYAGWEESQLELQRARSVYERALDVDHRSITIWLRYAEMEMRHRQVNHARNVWDRAVTILPRANQFWYKYTYMEEMLGNIAGARQVFERWMEWEPEEQAWHSYINFELRYKELDRARVIYEKFVIVHPDIKNWLKYAKFEEKNQFISSARRIYERAVEYFGDENIDETLLISFAKFEEGQREHDRARVIYKYALDHLPKDKCQEVYKQYTIHEKKFGDRTAIEDVIVSKRKFKYEEEIKLNPFNYDAWFDYLRLMESDGKFDDVREIYERAIANVPPSQEKRHWRRYIYLWINYAIFEELECNDVDRARQVYQACIEIIPHKRFTFAKVWLLFAYFEVRQKNLTMARKILGASIGKCPKDKLFRGYIELELQLREFDRCRKLYEKFLEFSPENCTTWMKFAEVEAILGDVERARSIFELAIAQPKLDMPEVLWKAYIDFEMEQEEYENTRNLYRRLLQRTKHVKVWLSYAQFELSVGGEDFVPNARDVYRQANLALKECEEKEERLMLLESWKEFEVEHGDEQSLANVNKMMPNKVKRRRKIQTDNGNDAGWEEYYDYIFPDDESAQPNLKLLAMAKMWKKQVETHPADDSDDVIESGKGQQDQIAESNNVPPKQFIPSWRESQSENESSSGEEQEQETSKRLRRHVDPGEETVKTIENGKIEEFDHDLDRDDSISSTSSESSDSEEEEKPKRSSKPGRKMMRPRNSDSEHEESRGSASKKRPRRDSSEPDSKTHTNHSDSEHDKSSDSEDEKRSASEPKASKTLSQGHDSDSEHVLTSVKVEGHGDGDDMTEHAHRNSASSSPAPQHKAEKSEARSDVIRSEESRSRSRRSSSSSSSSSDTDRSPSLHQKVSDQSQATVKVEPTEQQSSSETSSDSSRSPSPRPKKPRHPEYPSGIQKHGRSGQRSSSDESRSPSPRRKVPLSSHKDMDNGKGRSVQTKSSRRSSDSSPSPSRHANVKRSSRQSPENSHVRSKQQRSRVRSPSPSSRSPSSHRRSSKQSPDRSRTASSAQQSRPQKRSSSSESSSSESRRQDRRRVDDRSRGYGQRRISPVRGRDSHYGRQRSSPPRRQRSPVSRSRRSRSRDRRK